MGDSENKIKLIADSGETNRLIIRDSLLEECDRLQEINEASDYIEKWVGWKTPVDYALKTITEGNLPPEGKRELFSVKSVCLKATTEIIGVAELYHGYPTADALCIGWLFIHPGYQKQGYAKEVFDYIAEEASKAGFNKIRLGVHLKNWPALRFWHKMGFDRLVGIVGDEEHCKDANASILLEYSVKP